MKVSTDIYFCLTCNNSGKTPQEIIHDECAKPSMILKANIAFEMKQTRWHRFLTWFYSRDFALGFAILGLVGLNTIFMHHVHTGIIESSIEGFCFGLLIPRLIL